MIANVLIFVEFSTILQKILKFRELQIHLRPLSDFRLFSVITFIFLHISIFV